MSYQEARTQFWGQAFCAVYSVYLGRNAPGWTRWYGRWVFWPSKGKRKTEGEIAIGVSRHAAFLADLALAQWAKRWNPKETPTERIV